LEVRPNRHELKLYRCFTELLDAAGARGTAITHNALDLRPHSLSGTYEFFKQTVLYGGRPFPPANPFYLTTA
jgi:hypothetical protein